LADKSLKYVEVDLVVLALLAVLLAVVQVQKEENQSR